VGVQLGVALLVALEGAAGAVEAVGVQLDDQVAVRPVGVDLVAVEQRVHRGTRDAVAVAEVEKRRLEVAAGEGGTAVEEGLDPSRSRPAGADGEQ